MSNMGRLNARSPGGTGKEMERASSRGTDRLAAMSPCIVGRPRAVSPCMIGGRRALSPGRPKPLSPGVEGVERALALHELEGRSRFKPIKSSLESKPGLNNIPVRIRPPSPAKPSPKEPTYGCSLSSDPPTRPIMRRRAQSLPLAQVTYKNRQVRFIDARGLQLEDIKVFRMGEEPQIPAHVFSRLLMSSEINSRRSLELSLPYFKPCFPENRGSQPGFAQRLERQVVSLDQVLCSEMGIMGTVQVLNLAYDKEVMVLYSFTNWRSSAETRGCWVTTLRSDPTKGPEADVFRFRLPVPPFILQAGALLEFAVRYRVAGAEYWDNNDGCNYKLSCHSYKLTVPLECEDSMVHFT
ncbi:protein phosphatase 1 regulatory subunit 3D [Esox lucius]|uniref:CBM21 domain-containing protein n=1 Tax=Esox lucius TaxID=8010 RepID=A0AAY5KNF6_ESOLU|nr:protein phosphatase 1 regulatory subunit 3D [Esox lucius]